VNPRESWRWGVGNGGLAVGAAIKRERERGKSEKSLVKNNYLFIYFFRRK
jgi:hypothetical protein